MLFEFIHVGERVFFFGEITNVTQHFRTSLMTQRTETHNPLEIQP